MTTPRESVPADFGMGARVRLYDGRVFEVNGIGGNGNDHMHCSFRFVDPPAVPIVGFGAAANTLAETTVDPAGVMLDRTAMALAKALEALRETVPNHHPARVGARKALDAWVEWSASSGRTEQST